MYIATRLAVVVAPGWTSPPSIYGVVSTKWTCTIYKGSVIFSSSMLMNDVSLICTCIRKSFNVNRLNNQDIFGLSYLLGLEPRLSIPHFDLKFCLSPNLQDKSPNRKCEFEGVSHRQTLARVRLCKTKFEATLTGQVGLLWFVYQLNYYIASDLVYVALV